MTDRPMIFSAPMICALKDGRKTQHRVVLDNVPPSPGDTIHARYAGGGNLRAAPYLDSYCSGARTGENPRGMSDEWCWWTRDDRKGASFKVRFVPGDRLWVREKWSVSATGVWTIADARRRIASDQRIIYAADGNPEGPWWASTQMPREFSRFTLIVTEVRVERLQDISETDAIAEGVYFVEPTAEDFAWNKARCEERGLPDDGDMQGVWMAPGTRQGWGRTKEQRAREQWGPTAAFAYRCVWESLHGAGAWALNPWVCSIGFTVERRNIDEARL